MGDNINESELKQISKILEKEYKINKGTVTLTIVPKIDGSQENGKVNAAEVRINMTGDVGTNAIDGVNQFLYGLFRSSVAISKYPTFNKQDNSCKTFSVYPSVVPGISLSKKMFSDGFEFISISQALFFLSIKISRPRI